MKKNNVKKKQKKTVPQKGNAGEIKTTSKTTP